MKISLTVILLFTLTGCTHYYYIPAAQNVPLFMEKNEYRASFHTGGGEEISTTDIQAAYSFTDKFAVMANGMVANGGNKETNWGEGKYLEAALGYFKPFDSHAVFEIYGGFGGGNQFHQYHNSGTTDSYDGTADLSFTKFFIQPSLGFTFNGFDIAYTSGFSVIDFYKVNNKIDRQNNDYFTVNTISHSRNFILFEPSITIRGGWKYVKLQAQFTGVNNLSHSNMKFEKSKISIGLNFAFAERFRKKLPQTP